MKKLLIILLFFIILASCKSKKQFDPQFVYKCNDSVILLPDSNMCTIKFVGILVGKDTNYFYGIEYDSSNTIIRKIINENRIAK